MSETPITDALIDAGRITTGDVASSMRKLERDLRKCEAGAAVMREALQQIPPACVSRDAGFIYQSSGSAWCLWMDKRNAALATNAGCELLAEVELLRFGCNQVAQVAFERDEAVRENLNLRRKVKAAEGMATALALCAKIPICVYPEGLYIDLEDHAAIIAALAAWKEANESSSATRLGEGQK